MMNERKFKKRINSKANKDGDLTFAIVKELLGQSNKPIIKAKILPKIINRFTKQKSAEEIIEKNYKMILEKVSNDYLEHMVRLFITNPKLEQVLMNNFDDIMTIIDNKPNCKTNLCKILVRDFVYKSEKIEKFILSNLEKIMENIQVEDLWKAIQGIKKFASENERKKLNAYLEDNKLEVCRTLLSYLPYKGESIEEFANTLLIMIEELLENENKQFIDINYLNQGVFSRAYEIGNKVIKIGDNRMTYQIPNHPRILQPLIRTKLINKDKTSLGCIEITRKVIPAKVSDENIKESLYELYKELRQDGLFCSDIKLENLGWLIEENNNNYSINGQELKVDPHSVGFDRELNGEEALNKGKLVILDLDLIYRVGENDEIITGNNMIKQLEKRYQAEKRGEPYEDYEDFKDSFHEEETPKISTKPSISYDDKYVR